MVLLFWLCLLSDVQYLLYFCFDRVLTCMWMQYDAMFVFFLLFFFLPSLTKNVSAELFPWKLKVLNSLIYRILRNGQVKGSFIDKWEEFLENFLHIRWIMNHSFHSSICAFLRTDKKLLLYRPYTHEVNARVLLQANWILSDWVVLRVIDYCWNHLWAE